MGITRSGNRRNLLVLTILLTLSATAWSQDTIGLREAFPVGYQYHVSSRVEVSGSLSLPAEKGKPAPKPLAVTGSSLIEYDERVLAVGGDGRVQKTARIYRSLEFQRKVGDQPQQSTIRPAVRRLILLRHKTSEVPFSPDGPLTWGEIDLVRTDVFTPALVGLLPKQPVRPGDHWPATNEAVQELTDLEGLEGRLECRFEQVTVLGGRRHARVGLAGSVRGTNEDGPNRQQLEGYYFFDLESNHLSYLYIKGVHVLLDKDSKEVGRIEGRFVLTRQAQQRSPDLTDEALRGVPLEPNADNTLLLYDNPDLGVRLLYPRRWRVAGVRGRQLALDEATGSGLLLTLEPKGKAPTGAQFLVESRDYLVKQKAKVLSVVQPRRLQNPPQELEHFALDIETNGQRAWMDYYVARQTQGGATLAARLLPDDLANLKKDVERIARSLTITFPTEGQPK
jgi:hypothetical protein